MRETERGGFKVVPHLEAKLTESATWKGRGRKIENTLSRVGEAVLSWIEGKELNGYIVSHNITFTT